MARPSKYSPELRERAVQMVLESEKDYPHRTAAIKSVASMLGSGHPNSSASGSARPRSTKAGAPARAPRKPSRSNG